MFFFLQALKGDTVDGYGGCPRIGQKRAWKLLHPIKKKKIKAIERPAEYWKAILTAYTKAGLDETYALQQARVARILTNSDYDFTKQKEILWTPPTLTT